MTLDLVPLENAIDRLSEGRPRDLEDAAKLRLILDAEAEGTP